MEKLKLIFIGIGTGILAVLGFLIGRRNSDGSGIQRANDITGDIGTGNDQLGDSLERGIEYTEELGARVEDGIEHTGNAKSANQRAQEILRHAKDRKPPKP